MGKNAAAVPGTTMNDWAKMIGITPAEFTRSGMKLFCPSRMRPRPTTFRGICTGIFRAAMVMATTPALTPMRTASSITTLKRLSSPRRNDSYVRPVAAGNESMMEKKIRRLMPFPIPRSVICSPSHITKTAPVMSATMVVNTNSAPGSRTAPGIDCRNTE